MKVQAQRGHTQRETWRVIVCTKAKWKPEKYLKKAPKELKKPNHTTPNQTKPKKQTQTRNTISKMSLYSYFEFKILTHLFWGKNEREGNISEMVSARNITFINHILQI